LAAAIAPPDAISTALWLAIGHSSKSRSSESLATFGAPIAALIADLTAAGVTRVFAVGPYDAVSGALSRSNARADQRLGY
jgi:hypothetical protein